MVKYLFSLFLLSFLHAANAYSQAGCSDAGVCTLGGHSSESTDSSSGLNVQFVQTFSFNSDYTYLESTPSIGYDPEIIRAELAVNWRHSRSRVAMDAGQVASVREYSGKGSPRIQHVEPHMGVHNSAYGFGDAKLNLTLPASDLLEGLRLHVATIIPLTELYQDREQDLQSTFGLPSLLAGVSYDEAAVEWSYGGTIAYQTTFGKENALHTTRADDAALAVRISHTPEWVRSIGFDLSAIYHLADDKLHGTPTREIVGYEKTAGLTVNVGASTVFSLADDALDLSVFVAAPVVGIAHVDGLKRSFVGGVSLLKSL